MWVSLVSADPLLELQLGGLPDEALGLFHVLHSWKLDEDTVAAKQLDGRLSHAERVGTTFDLVLHTFHLALGHVLVFSFIDELHSALQVQAQLKPQRAVLVTTLKADAADAYVKRIHKQCDHSY